MLFKLRFRFNYKCEIFLLCWFYFMRWFIDYIFCQIVEIGDKDSIYYKIFLVGMKKDFNVELEKIKSYLIKERFR